MVAGTVLGGARRLAGARARRDAVSVPRRRSRSWPLAWRGSAAWSPRRRRRRTSTDLRPSSASCQQTERAAQRREARRRPRRGRARRRCWPSWSRSSSGCREAARDRAARRAHQRGRRRRSGAPRRGPSARAAARGPGSRRWPGACARCTRCRPRAGALPAAALGRRSGRAARSPSATSRSLAALDARLIQEYRGTSDRLEDRRRREETRQRELADLRADAQREQAEVDRDAAKRRTLLARVRDERAYHERMVGELTEAARRLEAFIRELQAKQRRLARVPPPKRGGAEPPGGGVRHAPGPAAVADGRADHRGLRGPGAPAVRHADVPEWRGHRGRRGARGGGGASAATSSTRGGSKGTET